MATLAQMTPMFWMLMLVIATILVTATWVVRRIRRFRRGHPAVAASPKSQPPRRLLVGQLAAGGAMIPDIARRTGLAQDAVRVLMAR